MGEKIAHNMLRLLVGVFPAVDAQGCPEAFGSRITMK